MRRSAQSADAAERPLEVLDRGHRDGVDHLLVELRVRLRGRQAVLRQQVRMVEIDRVVEDAAGRIDVDDLDVFADRARLEVVSQGTSTVISLNVAVSRRVARLGSKARTRSRRVTGCGTRAASR